MDLTKPLPRTIELPRQNGQVAIVEVDYPWVPPTCSNCSELGHIRRNCLLPLNDTPSHSVFVPSSSVEATLEILPVNPEVQHVEFTQKHSSPDLSDSQKHPLQLPLPDVSVSTDSLPAEASECNSGQAVEIVVPAPSSLVYESVVAVPQVDLNTPTPIENRFEALSPSSPKNRDSLDGVNSLVTSLASDPSFVPTIAQPELGLVSENLISYHSTVLTSPINDSEFSFGSFGSDLICTDDLAMLPPGRQTIIIGLSAIRPDSSDTHNSKTSPQNTVFLPTPARDLLAPPDTSALSPSNHPIRLDSFVDGCPSASGGSAI